MSASPRSAGAFDRRLKLAIASLTAAVWLTLAGLRAHDAWQRRGHTLAAGERRAANLALTVATQIRGAFAGADATLRQLTLYSRQVGGPGGPAERWRPMLQLSRTQRNGIGSLTVTDAAGIIRHSTVPDIIGDSRKDTFLFRRLSVNDRDLMHADTPFRALTNPALMLVPLGRRLTTAEGAFDGVVVATFTPIHLRKYFEQLDIGRTGRISVYHPEGFVIFRVPSATDPIGERADDDPLFRHAQQMPRPEAVRMPAGPGVPAQVAAFQLTGEPRLFVAVSLEEGELLAEWRHDTAIAAGVLAVVGLGLVLVVRFVFRQLDARAVAEEALARAQRLDALGQLTGGVAHDFNNFLTVIMMHVSVLKLPGGAGAAGSPDATTIAQIDHATRRAAALTQQLLTIARRQPLQPQLVDLNVLVRELEPILGRLLGETIEIKLRLAAEPCAADVDHVHFETALINLGINARDAMPQGGQLLIETERTTIDEAGLAPETDIAPGRYVRLSVSDTGTGISREHQTRVFEPFFTTKPVGKGTGLGLSMVYGFMKQSGGHVKLYSEPGRGTAVRLYFPLAKGTPPPRELAKKTVMSARPGEVILLLEDEAVVRQVAEMMLRKLGYRIVSATHGAEALQRAREMPRLDLFFTDVVLPGGMNGREVAEQLARERPGLRVLYASGYSQDILQDRGQLPAQFRVISKPYDIHTLAEAIRAAIDTA